MKYTKEELKNKILEGASVIHLPNSPKTCHRVTLLGDSIRIDYFPIDCLYDNFPKVVASYTCSLDSYGKEWRFFDEEDN